MSLRATRVHIFAVSVATAMVGVVHFTDGSTVCCDWASGYTSLGGLAWANPGPDGLPLWGAWWGQLHCVQVGEISAPAKTMDRL